METVLEVEDESLGLQFVEVQALSSENGCLVIRERLNRLSDGMWRWTPV